MTKSNKKKYHPEWTKIWGAEPSEQIQLTTWYVNRGWVTELLIQNSTLNCPHFRVAESGGTRDKVLEQASLRTGPAILSGEGCLFVYTVEG
jgi:hypothetical protein